ncbi:hypothetical protein OIU85_019492 [Salix viminalis]|uniref:KNOX1 domain-containing protein n=1 Tax=Salix viminalis TaxID=40686 RepID=A0A9Q0UXA6_SALVM|nr:hypothetical protein OIU85_019492 [Salix viminalis]
MESSSMNNTAEKDVDLLVDTAEAEVLKKRISSHPLYGLLVQAHIDCLKVGSIGGVDESPRVRPKLPSQFPNPSSLSQPELDSFMVTSSSHLLPPSPSPSLSLSLSLSHTHTERQTDTDKQTKTHRHVFPSKDKQQRSRVHVLSNKCIPCCA